MAAIKTNTPNLEEILATVNSLPTQSVVQLQEKSVTPSASAQTVTPDSGYTGLSQVNVSGDSNLVASNIISGKTIFGVAGSANVGVTVQKKNGTFYTSNSGTATVNCGFKPDAVFITVYVSEYGLTFHGAVAFTEGNATEFMTYVPGSSTSYFLSIVQLSQTSSGFTVTAQKMDTSFATSNETYRSFNYIAIKYTE